MYVLWINFICGLNFYFPFFLDIVIYDNEFETKEDKIETKDKMFSYYYYFGSNSSCVLKKHKHFLKFSEV